MKPAANNRWPVWKRLSFRFVLCYVLIYCVSLAGEVISYCVFLAAKPSTFPVSFPATMWRHIVPWVGAHVLRLGSVPALTGGSGDTLYDWLQVLCELMIACVAATVWTVLDQGRRRDDALYRWLRLAVRTLLAAEMFLYGLDKVFPLQFRDMTLTRMMRPMSSNTPMGVLWDFMAASVLYTVFAGSIEVLGGVLLLIPQTVTLGALLCVAAMTNVFVLNLGYDVPVKRGSGHLLLLSIFLAAAAVPRLANFFLFNRDAHAEKQVPLSTKPWVNRASIWVPMALCLIVAIIASVAGFQTLNQKRHAEALRSPFYGIWTFASFEVADPVKPLLTEKLVKSMHVEPGADRWRKMIFEDRGSATIELGDGTLDYVEVKQDARTTSITDSGDPSWQCLLTFQNKSGGVLEMAGTVNGNPVRGELTRQDETKFAFTRRRFHWINEW